ncbi:MAG: hypothetical protein JW778_01150 [Candidatus Altiarchaeota archaeon]|nr:hypothetical protein [Candidatus Altiarchaeota archaeon]
MESSKTKIAAIALIVFLLSCIALPQEEDPGSSGLILSKLLQIPEHFFLYVVEEILKATMNAVVDLLKTMILWNPNPDDIKPMVDDFIEILIPVYVIIIIVLGIYIIFVSISPSGRAKAKSMFWKTLLSMMLVSISLEIFKILLAISDALSNRMLAGVVTTRLPQFMMTMAMNPHNLFFLYLNLVFFLLSALIVIALRYILVLTLCALFPFTLFLYFFEFTKEIGSKLLRYTLMAIYTQVVQALMLAITVISMNSLRTGSTGGENIVYAFLFIAGSLMIVLAPLMMMGIMKWIGGALAGAGMVVSFINPALGGIMVAAGGIAAGMGPGALIAGGTATGLGWAYRKGGT